MSSGVRSKMPSVCVENENTRKKAGMATLLRLDSTGEVSSAKRFHNSRKPCRNGAGLNFCQKKNNNSYYNGIVENLSMGSLITSASNYLHTFCPNTASKLTRGSSEDSKLGFMKNLLYKNSPASDSSFTMNSHPETKGMDNLCYCERGLKPDVSADTKADKSTWPGVMFGALISSCQSAATKMQKYVPPQKRKFCERRRHQMFAPDPTLTPYNAKLLEKSKQNHCERSVQEKETNSSEKSCMKTVNNTKNEKSVVTESRGSDSCRDTKVSDNALKACNRQSASDICDVNNDKVDDSTDWFDYESQTAKCIPVCIDKLHSTTQEPAILSNSPGNSQGSDSNPQQLHSWLSLESDESVEKKGCYMSASEESSQKPKECITSDSLSGICPTWQETEHSDVSRKSGHSSCHNLGKPNTNVLPSNEIHKDNNNCKNGNPDDPISVLYVRNISKKGRPSAKKRRRHKAQQNDDLKQLNSCMKQRSALKSSNAVHQNSSISFILGYDSNRSENYVHSFHMTLCDNSDSDWTESDGESDETSLEDDTDLSGDLGFKCNDPFMKIRLSVQPTSIQSTDVPPKSPNACKIEEINSLWKIHVSLESDVSKKNPDCSKQVHFADAKHLATVHPIIAWSHAYQAARIGPWEQYARDRGRFMRRITDGEKLLEPVLNNDHRNRIYDERFNDETQK